MTPDEIDSNYEWNTGGVIIRRFAELDPLKTTAVLVAGHAPFCWGPDPVTAVQNAVTLEEVAHLAWLSTVLAPDAGPLDAAVRDKHFQRKHGPGAYYGQG